MQYPRFISLAGGLLAFFSFALPWVEVYRGVSLVIAGFHPILVILIILITLIGFGIYCTQSISRAAGVILTQVATYFQIAF